MKGILADVNVQGHLERLLQIWTSNEWRELWESLSLEVFSLAKLGLPNDVADSVIWRECQHHQLVLLTANRNNDGPDSLEATIRVQNTTTSLPVFTLADAERLLHETVYAQRVAERFLDYLLAGIDRVHGAGRLFFPEGVHTQHHKDDFRSSRKAVADLSIRVWPRTDGS